MDGLDGEELTTGNHLPLQSPRTGKQQREAADEDTLAPIHFAVMLQSRRAPLCLFGEIGFPASPMHPSPLFPAATAGEEIMCRGVKLGIIRIATGVISPIS